MFPFCLCSLRRCPHPPSWLSLSLSLFFSLFFFTDAHMPTHKLSINFMFCLSLFLLLQFAVIYHFLCFSDSFSVVCHAVQDLKSKTHKPTGSVAQSQISAVQINVTRLLHIHAVDAHCMPTVNPPSWHLFFVRWCFHVGWWDVGRHKCLQSVHTKKERRAGSLKCDSQHSGGRERYQRKEVPPVAASLGWSV